MTTSLSDLYNESVVLTSVDGKEVRYFDHELFASLIIDLAVECVRDELRDPQVYTDLRSMLKAAESHS